jgi:hypothetical protein
MHNPTTPTREPPATEVLIDLRAEDRVHCPGLPVVPLSARGTFHYIPVRVRDISTKGIGFFTAAPLEPGARVALCWDEGPVGGPRTVPATVVHCGPDGTGAWRAGCSFDEPLTSGELDAFVQSARPASHRDRA